MRTNQLLALFLSFFVAASAGAATRGIASLSNDRATALKELRSQQLAYIEIEKAAALMEYYGLVLGQADLRQQVDPFLLHQLYRDLLKPLESASYLSIGDADLVSFTHYWQLKIKQAMNPTSLSGLDSLDRQIASAANQFEVDHEEMTIRLVPIRKKPQFRQVNVEMHLKAAKAIADSTIKLVNSESLHRLFTYNSDSSFLYRHGEVDSLRNQALDSRNSITKIMLLQVSQQLSHVIKEKKMAPARAKAIQLIHRNKEQNDKVDQIPVSQKANIKTVQTQVAAETEFEIRQMLAQINSPKAPE